MIPQIGASGGRRNEHLPVKWKRLALTVLTTPKRYGKRIAVDGDGIYVAENAGKR